MHEVLVKQDSNFLQIEKGPSTDITMQWATYFDASNESSLSRIYGGIHPPTDDGWGRYIGQQVATSSFLKSKALFSAFALPFNVSRFEFIPADCQTDIRINLTTNEHVKRYELFRVLDGQETLLNTFVASSGEQAFSYHDTNPNTYSNYLLKSVNPEGERKTVAAKAAWIGNCADKTGLLSLYPNPGSTYVKLDIRSEVEGDALITISDLTGRIWQTNHLTVGLQKSTQTLATESLQAGTYIIRYINPNGEGKSFTWLKQD